jgi:signal transduction histidine kinase
VLVTDLLDLARMDADRFRVQLVPVPAALPLEQAADALWSTAERKGVTIEADLPDLPVIVTDPDRVQQVMTNLVDNAIRWTPSGGTVRIVARPVSGGGVIAEVSDTGPGIAPEMRDVLFDPFRSAVTPEGNQGSGLGLAIAHQLTRALGGDLTAGDAAGGGACFTLTLPAQAPAPKNDEGPPSEMDEGPTPTAMGGQASA